MARNIDIINTVNTRVATADGVSLALNELGLHPLGYALPLGLPFRYQPTVKEAGRGEVGAYGGVPNMSQDYLALGDYVFRLDPIVAVSGKNIITRRYVAKGSVQGTVKESFSQDDYEVTISGVLIGENAEELREQVQALREVLESGESLAVVNEMLLDGYGITRLVVESFFFPHTKGLENQAYSIKCYSDSSVNILEEI